MLRVLQICNVGKIVGGTAACAWSITQALPECEHQIIFLSRIHTDTRQAFGAMELHHSPLIDSKMIRSTQSDVVIMHNTSRSKILDSAALNKLEIPLIQYAHSQIDHQQGDLNVCCSEWLRKNLAQSRRNLAVLHQHVPLASLELLSGERLPVKDETEIIVGRLCTPSANKWPETCSLNYRHWSRLYPQVVWEFVGCPREMEQEILSSCGGRARFFPASFSARGHLCRWDALLYHQPGCVESFGRVVAEALRVGCIPIVDRLGGFCEQVMSGSGFLCSSAQDFQHALLQIHDSRLKQKISIQAKQAGERFSCSAFRQRFFRLFA